MSRAPATAPPSGSRRRARAGPRLAALACTSTGPIEADVVDGPRLRRRVDRGERPGHPERPVHGTAVKRPVHVSRSRVAVLAAVGCHLRCVPGRAGQFARSSKGGDRFPHVAFHPNRGAPRGPDLCVGPFASGQSIDGPGIREAARPSSSFRVNPAGGVSAVATHPRPGGPTEAGYAADPMGPCSRDGRRAIRRSAGVPAGRQGPSTRCRRAMRRRRACARRRTRRAPWPSA